MLKAEEPWLPGMEPGAEKKAISDNDDVFVRERKFIVFDFPKIDGIKFSYSQRKQVIFANIKGWSFMCKVAKREDQNHLEFKDFTLIHDGGGFYDGGKEIKEAKAIVEQKLIKSFPELKKEIEDNIDNYRYLFDN